MKVIAIANQKGGVSKTSSACAFAAGLKRKGYRVLAVDMDPQGNLSDHVAADSDNDTTIYELLKLIATPEAVIQHLDVFDIIPANIELAAAELEITQTGKEHRLREVLSPIAGLYDYVVIDTPPSLGTLTIMAFTFADEIIIPSNAQIFSTKGITKLKDTIDNVRKYTNPNIKIAGILLTAYNPRTKLSQAMRLTTEMLCETFKAPLFQTTIRVATAMGEAQAFQQDIFSYDAKSTVAQDYIAVVDEFIKMEGLTK